VAATADPDKRNLALLRQHVATLKANPCKGMELALSSMERELADLEARLRAARPPEAKLQSAIARQKDRANRAEQANLKLARAAQELREAEELAAHAAEELTVADMELEEARKDMLLQAEEATAPGPTEQASKEAAPAPSGAQDGTASVVGAALAAARAMEASQLDPAVQLATLKQFLADFVARQTPVPAEASPAAPGPAPPPAQARKVRARTSSDDETSAPRARDRSPRRQPPPSTAADAAMPAASADGEA
jgi:hypothetical protein